MVVGFYVKFEKNHVMRNLMLFIALFYCTLLFSQIGINVKLPTEMLDVNGTMRIRKISELKDDSVFDLMVFDNEGVMRSVAKTGIEIKREEVSVTLNAKQSIEVVNTLGFEVSNIVVTTVNACDRAMICSFQSNMGSLLFINGIARDVAAQAQVIPIPKNSSSGVSAAYEITFPDVRGCTNDNSGSDDFNFKLEKTSTKKYKLTNNGNVTRTYILVFKKIA